MSFVSEEGNGHGEADPQRRDHDGCLTGRVVWRWCFPCPPEDKVPLGGWWVFRALQSFPLPPDEAKKEASACIAGLLEGRVTRSGLRRWVT